MIIELRGDEVQLNIGPQVRRERLRGRHRFRHVADPGPRPRQQIAQRNAHLLHPSQIIGDRTGALVQSAEIEVTPFGFSRPPGRSATTEIPRA